MKESMLLRIFLLILVFSALSWFLNASPVDEYVTALKAKGGHDEGLSRKPAPDDPLYRYIVEFAGKHKVPPVDAKVDRVWKAIPGYNGLEVDVDATYALAKTKGEKIPSQWVFRQVEPKVQLSDLPPSPIYRGNPHKPMVAFMVNVAWGTEHLPSMLKTFRDAGVKATFFLDGSWLRKHPQEARNIVAEGHEIGNHAYTHPAMSKLSAGKIREEIARTQELIKETLGVTSALFAPPSGDYDQRVVNLAKEMGQYTVLWTVDTVDWQKPSPSVIIDRVIPKLENGALVLMHPTEPTAKALPALIEKTREKGLRLGTVSELLSSQRVEPLK
ncbi:polysaccharide deacetylase family protein [Bacillaceae bacterium]